MGAAALMPIRKRQVRRAITDKAVTDEIDAAIHRISEAIGDDAVVVVTVKRGTEAFTVTKTKDWPEAMQALQSIVRKHHYAEPFEI
jgi:hypothetical protein